jgi:hypothetical protein
MVIGLALNLEGDMDAYVTPTLVELGTIEQLTQQIDISIVIG